MTKTFINSKDLGVWVHTWWKRDGVRDPTIDSMDASDAAGRYEVLRQAPSECPVEFFMGCMRDMCDRFDWIVRIEDDTVVNEHLIHNVCTWAVPFEEPRFGMGFLSAPELALADTLHTAYGEVHATPWRKFRGMHFGGGMLWKADTFRGIADDVEACLLQWIREDRLACAVCPSSVLYDRGLRAYFHLPSLVRIDLSIPRSTDGLVLDESDFGSQPFDRKFRR
jgi:hypothetical protein